MVRRRGCHRVAPPRVSGSASPDRPTTASTSAAASAAPPSSSAGRSRAIRPVSTSPRRKPGCRASAIRKSRFVTDPATSVSTSACSSARSAMARVGAWVTTLAIIGSYHGLIASPGRTPVSIRAPSGKRRWDRRPVAGRKPAGTSSAYSRASNAWPVIAMSCCCRGSGSPLATRSCHSTRSIPVIASVTGCSTCRRVFISMNQKPSGRRPSAPSTMNSIVPAPE